MADLLNTRVLLVDDSPIWRTFLIAHLYDAGLSSVYVAHDGVQAVRKAASLQPDLILIDVRLPKMNGIEAAELIRDVAPLAKVVFLSSCSDPDVKAAALKAGGCEYIVKSLAGRQLIIAIQRALRGDAENA